MGKEQFKNKKRVYQLIHQHMLPSKTPQQLRCHFYCSGKMVKDKSIVWVRSSFFPLLLDEAVKHTTVLFYYVHNVNRTAKKKCVCFVFYCSVCIHN